MAVQIPKSVQKLVDHYRNLNIAGITVPTPYYRNVKRVRAGLRSLIGKGTPEEIEEETLIYSKLRGFVLHGKSPEQIREFMEGQGLGVDCSGFAVHVYDTWLRVLGCGGIYRNIFFPKANLYRSLVRRFRPVENIGANLLTGPDNAGPVSIRDVQVGDVIRLKGVKTGHHVAIIWEVEQDESGHPTVITYVQSTEHYGKDNGVRYGKVEIVDLEAELKDQRWLDVDTDGTCWTKEQLMKDYEDNGLRRPNFFADNH